MRVSLISLLGAAAFVGFAALLLSRPHHAWQGLAENTLIVLAALMMVAVFAGRGRTRAFGLGFLILAGLYLPMCYPTGSGLRESFFTHHALRFAREHCVGTQPTSIAFNSPQGRMVQVPELRTTRVAHETTMDASSGDGGSVESPASAATLLTERDSDEQYFCVGHLLWAMLLGFVGGVFAAAMRNESREAEAARP